MTTKIPDTISTGPISSINGPSQLDELSELAIVKGVNLAQLMAKTYLIVEQKSEAKSHLKIDELEAHEKKLKLITEFLSEIESQLSSNPNAKEINMADKSEMVENVRQLINHKLLEKSVWKRDEADILKMALTRDSQIIMQQISHKSSDVNRAIEEGTELLQIARKILEMYQQFISTVTRNQRGG
jgi:hypothetical protein